MSDKENFTKCIRCEEYHWDNEKCPPVFYFKHGNWGDEFQEIRAVSFEDAAEKFATKYNEDGEYVLMGNTEKVIISDGKTEKTFEVGAETSIQYSVEEVEL